ncbi:methylmalonyl Co-A mutase-associated GTPase MeaB [Oceanomicrobium pacificus]|uniref:Methylmalonyl Co-A mutase-associated GTPase MeaB n=1 Tax=Oceanomicrobium pacificus TaxID=2692916 RepID=A0A6B0TRJ2_9RHOB|nr:methylmalonyl Co-A mutase-associated GTPase MeaB [Oceanomicrobium pacificus]MXU66576.1 methylmalonyl Co-A mutase-associated GTPase MeaB [Oceanomicrobium pacificus]
MTLTTGVRDMAELAARIAAGDRRALSKGITLVESTRPDHRAEARALLAALPALGRPAMRLGLTGTPGVGKSTFIESFGLMLADDGLRVAVLAVDPSSGVSGGSILGDKTRMDRLSRHTGAYIRPSPSNRTLGGVARRTREAVRLCEAAGFDLVLIETVGVGQSETMVANMTDLFLLLLAPAGGDELQGVKRGIMEMADLVLVNKADGALKAEAERAAADYAGALRLMRHRPIDPDGFPKVRTVSAMTGAGLAEARSELETLFNWRRKQGVLAERRRTQDLGWFRDEVDAGLRDLLDSDEDLRAKLADSARAVADGAAPDAAAADLLDALRARLSG